MDPQGHAAVVTGAGSGLGAATAQHLAQAGRQGRASRRQPGRRRNGRRPHRRPGDPLRRGGCRTPATAALAAAREQHGAARILVNCAGIGPAKRIVGRDGPMPLADFQRVIAINLVGSFNMMRLAAADMTALAPLGDGERGIIVSTASVAAFEGQIGQAAYSASKGGVAALTRAGGARARPVRHPRDGDRAGHLRHPDAARPAGRRAGEPRRLGAVSRRCSAGRSSSPTSCFTACATPISTARSSASTARCAWRRAEA